MSFYFTKDEINDIAGVISTVEDTIENLSGNVCVSNESVRVEVFDSNGEYAGYVAYNGEQKEVVFFPEIPDDSETIEKVLAGSRSLKVVQ